MNAAAMNTDGSVHRLVAPECGFSGLKTGRSDIWLGVKVDMFYLFRVSQDKGKSKKLNFNN